MLNDLMTNSYFSKIVGLQYEPENLDVNKACFAK